MLYIFNKIQGFLGGLVNRRVVVPHGLNVFVDGLGGVLDDLKHPSCFLEDLYLFVVVFFH